MQRHRIFIITGLSGSGKSTAIAAFEDAGFYCVDNMPVALLPKFLELPVHDDADITGFAFVMDLRERGFIERYPRVFDTLRQRGCDFSILFLEAEENVLLKRFSQTRRHHPLSQDKGLLEGIRAEKVQLDALKRVANHVIDTSHYNVHELKSIIFDILGETQKIPVMKIHVQSFGFKYGLPAEADIVIDVRFLANPYFVPHLKALTGLSDEITAYIMDQRESRIFLEKYLDILDFLIPLYETEGKAYLTIAVGCTGGRHRSVVIARRIFDHIKTPDRRVEITHRDIEQNGV